MTSITLDTDQEEIRSVARRFLTDNYPTDRVREVMDADGVLDRESWNRISELGWSGIAVDEDRGGAGYGLVERCLLLEEMGRAVLPGPFLPSAVIASDLVAACGSTSAADELLAEIADGALIAAPVVGGDLYAGADPAAGVKAGGTDDVPELSGPGGITLCGDVADVLVVVAGLPDGSAGIFRVDPDAEGVTRKPALLVDLTRAVAEISFDSAPATRLDGSGDTADALRRSLARSTVALTAEMIGGAQQILDVTIGYLLERKQFGVLIGSFQALKHRAANIAVTIDAARECVYFAADVVDGADSEEASTVAAMAKAAASDAFVKAGQEAIQLHGGIGFTWEHDVHLYYKRALVSAATLGEARTQRARLATLLGV